MLSSNIMSTVGTILRINPYINYILVNRFHESCVRYLDQRWRENCSNIMKYAFRRGLTNNPNNFGPLTNSPDYTFKDGKPTPLGVRLKSRIDKQRDYAARIIKLVGEVDYAVERHARLEKEETEKRQQILDNKLKPKGDLLLQK